jgi:hypothetical protein
MMHIWSRVAYLIGIALILLIAGQKIGLSDENKNRPKFRGALKPPARNCSGEKRFSAITVRHAMA